ncbi:MAG TPA: hypothetical protein PKL48_11785, partial [Thermodesulfobacteriota bacterium]|nr:hypothetical protein [Thermodesulfobacteriota bacterium]
TICEPGVVNRSVQIAAWGTPTHKVFTKINSKVAATGVCTRKQTVRTLRLYELRDWSYCGLFSLGSCNKETDTYCHSQNPDNL